MSLHGYVLRRNNSFPVTSPTLLWSISYNCGKFGSRGLSEFLGTLLGREWAEMRPQHFNSKDPVLQVPSWGGYNIYKPDVDPNKRVEKK